jgi:hypothetical protein
MINYIVDNDISIWLGGEPSEASAYVVEVAA